MTVGHTAWRPVFGHKDLVLMLWGVFVSAVAAFVQYSIGGKYRGVTPRMGVLPQCLELLAQGLPIYAQDLGCLGLVLASGFHHPQDVLLLHGGQA